MQSCLTHLEHVQSAAQAVTAPALAQAKESKDFQRLFALQAALADGVLWDIERWPAGAPAWESDLAAYQE